MKRLRIHRRENVETHLKTVNNSDFGAKTTVTALKIQIFNSKFEFQASSCITDLKYYIYEASAGYGRRGGFHRRENSEKQRKTAKNSEKQRNVHFWPQDLPLNFTI